VNNLNVAIILSRAVFSERQSRILFCNFKKSLQWVMHTAKYAEVEPNSKMSYWHIYIKTKAGATHAVKHWLNLVQHLFQAFNWLLRSFTSSSSLYFQARTALRLLMMLVFMNQNGTDRSGQKQPELNFS